MNQSFYNRFGKRCFDITIAGLGLVFLSPLLILLWVLGALLVEPQALFRQLRPGKNGVIFELIKFKSMRSAEGLSDANRITPFGAFIRAASLDELPELWNVLKGEMSIVGPRPLLPEYLPLYSPRQAQRHLVRPGITGWAQVNGRNGLSWDEKFQHDIWYVENVSFRTDLKILLFTVWKVLKPGEISAPGHATMPFFTGNESKSGAPERTPNK